MRYRSNRWTLAGAQLPLRHGDRRRAVRTRPDVTASPHSLTRTRHLAKRDAVLSRSGHEDDTASLQESHSAVLSGDRPQARRERAADRGSPVLGRGLARAQTPGAAPRHDDTVLRERQEARDRRARAARPTHRNARNDGRDHDAADTRSARGRSAHLRSTAREGSFTNAPPNATTTVSERRSKVSP